jgi:hypothetical protein
VQELAYRPKHRRLKSGGKPMTLFTRCRKARPACLDMDAGTRRKLTAGGLAVSKRVRHLSEVEAEDIVQEETRPLQRGEPFQQQHECYGNVMRQIVGPPAIKGFVDHRFRQPLADIELAPRSGGLNAIEAQPRHHGAEIVSRLLDDRAVGGVPAQVGILHHVLRLGARAEHAISKTRQRAPVRFEGREVAVENRAHAAEAFCVACVTSRKTGSVSPPTTSRVQAWP